MRVKNPLSPHWSVAVFNERDPMCLSDMMVRLEPWMSAEEASMAERQTAVRGAAVGIDECRSNQFFKEATEAAWVLARQWIADDDDRGRLVGEDLAEAFAIELGHDARHAMPSVRPRKAMAMLLSVCRWAARHFDPSSRRRTAHPGALRGTLSGLSLHDRQAAGGRHAAGTRRDASVDAIQTAVAALRAEGVEVITKAVVARRAGVAYRTVLRHFDAAMSAFSEVSETRQANVTDGLRKIAPRCSGTSSSHHTLLQDDGSIRSDSPSVMPSAMILPFRTVPDRVPPPTRLSLDDGEDDDDVVMLVEHEAWLASQDHAPSEPSPWGDDGWFDAA
jgi:hypothetical protein